MHSIENNMSLRSKIFRVLKKCILFLIDTKFQTKQFPNKNFTLQRETYIAFKYM